MCFTSLNFPSLHDFGTSNPGCFHSSPMSFFFWLRQVFITVRRLSLVVVSRGYSSLWWAGSRRVGFSTSSTLSQQSWHAGPGAGGLQQLWLTGSRVRAQQLWCTGLAAPWHVGSSRTRDQTHVPCICRRILNHCTTREVPLQCL